jgi:hypothetical protein
MNSSNQRQSYQNRIRDAGTLFGEHNNVDIVERAEGYGQPDEYGSHSTGLKYLPQVAEINTPQPMDAAGVCSMYDKSMKPLVSETHAPVMAHY